MCIDVGSGEGVDACYLPPEGGSTSAAYFYERCVYFTIYCSQLL